MHTPPEATEKHPLVWRIITVAGLLAGTGALVWMIYSVGPSVILDHVREVGAWAFLIFAFDFGSLAADAASLREFIASKDKRVSYLRVFGAQASGRAINVLTFGGALGEPIKIDLLSRDADRGRVLSSIVLVNLVHGYVSIAVIVIGTPITLLLAHDIPGTLRILAIAGSVAMLGIAALLFWVVKRGIARTFTSIVRATRIISRERANGWKKKLADVDKHVQDLFHPSEASTKRGIAWALVAVLCGWLGMGTLLYAIGIHVTFTLVIGVLSVGVLISYIATVVPLGVGVADGGNYGLYAMLGATGAAGIAVSMLDRARSIAVALVGLIAFGVMQIGRRRG